MAATLGEEPVPPGDSDWRATFKHHLAFVLRAVNLHSSGAIDHMAASALWRKGALSFIASAPRSVAGRWRSTLASDSPVSGDCLLVVLDWVGNSYLGHEALCRGLATPAFRRLCGAADDGAAGNVLRGLLTPERISKHITDSGVPLAEE